MAIIEGEIESLKRLKENLVDEGITRFSSIGQINAFLKEYDAEREQLLKVSESALEAEFADKESNLPKFREDLENQQCKTKNDIKEQLQTIGREIEKLNQEKDGSILRRILSLPKRSSLSKRALKGVIPHSKGSFRNSCN